MESLQRGNRQAVNIEVDGVTKRFFVEALPQYKQLNWYDKRQVRIKSPVVGMDSKDLKEQQLESKQKRQDINSSSGNTENQSDKVKHMRGLKFNLLMSFL